MTSAGVGFMGQTVPVFAGNIDSIEARAAPAVGAGCAGHGAPVYLPLEPDPVLAFLHTPPAGSTRGTGVLLCPPFGWEEIVTYRSRRTWAVELARAGHPALRIDLPGTADSAGSARDPGRLDVWVAAIWQAAEWLRMTSGCERLAALGIGLGGLIVTKASAEGAPIDDLILWNVPARGRKIIRELRALTAVSLPDSQPADHGTDAGSDAGDVLDPAGRVLTAETADAIAGIDLAKLELPPVRDRRVLMLGRDGPTADERLSSHFAQTGAEVTLMDGEGYAALMRNPRLAVTPSITIAKSIGWLVSGAATEPTSTPNQPRAVSTDGSGAAAMEFQHSGSTIRETVISVELEMGNMFGILCEPAEAPCRGVSAVFISEGPARRVGPSRLWTETARRWAVQGVPTLRLDQPGIGDTDGDETLYQDFSELYAPPVGRSIDKGLEALQQHGLPDKVILVGLCSGAYWSVQGALKDDRIVGCFAINPPSLFWTRWTPLTIKIMANPGQWLGGGDRIMTEKGWLETRARRLARRARPMMREAAIRVDGGLRRVGLARDPVGMAFDRLRVQGKEVLLVMSHGEFFVSELNRNGQVHRLHEWPNLTLEILAGGDHAIRPVQMQRDVGRALDAGLSRVLARQGAAAVASWQSGPDSPRQR